MEQVYSIPHLYVKYSEIQKGNLACASISKHNAFCLFLDCLYANRPKKLNLK